MKNLDLKGYFLGKGYSLPKTAYVYYLLKLSFTRTQASLYDLYGIRITQELRAHD